jgi:hypothetical protein
MTVPGCGGGDREARRRQELQGNHRSFAGGPGPDSTPSISPTGGSPRVLQSVDRVGHADWYAGNTAIFGNALVGTFDWELVADTEAVIAGFAAACYAASSTGDGGLSTPEEVVVFLRDDDAVRADPLSRREQRAAAGAAAWILAFNARRQVGPLPRHTTPTATLPECATCTDVSEGGGLLVESEETVDVDLHTGGANSSQWLEVGRALLHREHPIGWPVSRLTTGPTVSTRISVPTEPLLTSKLVNELVASPSAEGWGEPGQRAFLPRASLTDTGHSKFSRPR